MTRTLRRAGRTTGTRGALAALAAGGLVAAATVPAQAAIDPPGDADAIAQIVSEMSIDQLIGQMAWVDFAGTDANTNYSGNQSRYGVGTPAQIVEKYDLGGVLYFAANVQNPTQLAELSNDLQAASIADGSGIPLATTIDQEGGIVARVGSPATVFPGNMALGAAFDADLAFDQGAVLGSELAAMGVNVDFAPSVDLNTNPANPVIGVRSMGADPQVVGELGAGQIRGMQSEGIAATAKHFPGHGDTVTDSHTGLPIITYDRATLDKHLEPFEAAIDAGVDMIMTAHIIVEAIDPDMPGTLSHKVLTELLREEMGFDGLITTDALNMAALKQLPDHPLTDRDIAALAIEAGSDILLFPPDLDAAIAGVHDAIDAGDITRDRLEESVTRILQWKLDRGVWEDPMVETGAVMDTVGSAANLAVADEVSERSVTLLRNEGAVLPLDADSDRVLMVGAGSGWPERMGPMLKGRGFTVTEDFENGSSPSEAYRNRAVAKAEGDDIDVVIFTSNNATGNAAQRAMVSALVATGKPVVIVSTRNPYDINVFPDADAVLNLYSYQIPSFAAATAAVAGDINPSGRLPVDVPTADGSDVLLPLGFGMRYMMTAAPEAPTFTDEPGTADDSVTIPDVEGVQYLLDGEAVEPGTYPGSGDVTVTAEPAEWYEFADDATTEWAFTFDAAGVPAAPQPPTFTDEDGTDDDAFTIPDVEGVQYLVDGEAVEPGTYPGSGTVVITAEPFEGFEFADDAVTEWTHEFDAGPTAPPTNGANGSDDANGADGSNGSDDGPGGQPTGSTPGGGGMPDTGADVHGGLLAALAMLAVGGAAVLAVRRRNVNSVG